MKSCSGHILDCEVVLSEKYVPFGGDKHVVNADVRLCGDGIAYASVVFRSKSDLDNLIASLTELRNGWDDPDGHIHLQDYGLTSDNDPTRLEINFFTPTWADTDSEKEMRESSIADARDFLNRTEIVE